MGNAIKGLIIDHCVFYNNDRHLIARGPGVTCTNTIFMDALDSSQGAWVSTPAAYYNNGVSGNNLFFGNARNFFLGGDILESTDLTVDPLFVDPDNGDFRLKPKSPCINAGTPTPEDGFTSIGAWQRKSFLRWK